MGANDFVKHYDIPTSAQYVTADATALAPGVRGFIPALDGTLRVRFRYDSEVAGAASTGYVVLPVLAGVVYPGDIRDVDITGSTASQEVAILRQL